MNPFLIVFWLNYAEHFDTFDEHVIEHNANIPISKRFLDANSLFCVLERINLAINLLFL